MVFCSCCCKEHTNANMKHVKIVYGIIFGILMLACIINMCIHATDLNCYLKVSHTKVNVPYSGFLSQKFVIHDRNGEIVTHAYSQTVDPIGFVCSSTSFGGDVGHVQAYYAPRCYLHNEYSCIYITESLMNSLQDHYGGFIALEVLIMLGLIAGLCCLFTVCTGWCNCYCKRGMTRTRQYHGMHDPMVQT